MALCITCGVSNAGLGGVPLVKVDEKYFCRRCLIKAKGIVRCRVCGITAGSTNDALFSTEDGHYICEPCHAKAGTGTAAAEVAATAQTATASVELPMDNLIGGLKKAYDEVVPTTEKVVGILMASSGEALVVGSRAAYVLKSGFAAGGGSAYKGRAIPYNEMTKVDLRAGLVQGYLQLLTAGARDIAGNSADAYQADYVVTFLGDAKAKFEMAAGYIRAASGK